MHHPHFLVGAGNCPLNAIFFATRVLSVSLGHSCRVTGTERENSQETGVSQYDFAPGRVVCHYSGPSQRYALGISVSPASGSGSAQTFSFVYSDPGGTTNLARGLFLTNSSLNAASACFAEYNRLT